MRSKLAVRTWIGKQKRRASIPMQVPEQLVSEQATPLTQGVDLFEAAGDRFPTVASERLNMAFASREATFRSVSRLGEGCYAHFLV